MADYSNFLKGSEKRKECQESCMEFVFGMGESRVMFRYLIIFNKVWQKYNVYIYYYGSYSKCIHYIFARLLIQKYTEMETGFPGKCKKLLVKIFVFNSENQKYGSFYSSFTSPTL